MTSLAEILAGIRQTSDADLYSSLQATTQPVNNRNVYAGLQQIASTPIEYGNNTWQNAGVGFLQGFTSGLFGNLAQEREMEIQRAESQNKIASSLLANEIQRRNDFAAYEDRQRVDLMYSPQLYGPRTTGRPVYRPPSFTNPQGSFIQPPGFQSSNYSPESGVQESTLYDVPSEYSQDIVQPGYEVPADYIQQSAVPSDSYAAGPQGQPGQQPIAQRPSLLSDSGVQPLQNQDVSESARIVGILGTNLERVGTPPALIKPLVEQQVKEYQALKGFVNDINPLIDKIETAHDDAGRTGKPGVVFNTNDFFVNLGQQLGFPESTTIADARELLQKYSAASLRPLVGVEGFGSKTIDTFKEIQRLFGDSVKVETTPAARKEAIQLLKDKLQRVKQELNNLVPGSYEEPNTIRPEEQTSSFDYIKDKLPPETRDYVPSLYAKNPNLPTRSNEVTPEIVEAVIGVESGGNPNAVSPKDAKGLMQLMDATGREMHKKLKIQEPYDPFNEEQNKKIGIAYLEEQLKRYNGDVPLALAAYNAGFGRVNNDIKRSGYTRSNLPAKALSVLDRGMFPAVKFGSAANALIDEVGERIGLTEPQDMSQRYRDYETNARSAIGDLRSRQSEGDKWLEFGMGIAADPTTYILPNAKTITGTAALGAASGGATEGLGGLLDYVMGNGSIGDVLEQTGRGTLQGGAFGGAFGTAAAGLKGAGKLGTILADRTGATDVASKASNKVGELGSLLAQRLGLRNKVEKIVSEGGSTNISKQGEESLLNILADQMEFSPEKANKYLKILKEAQDLDTPLTLADVVVSEGDDQLKALSRTTRNFIKGSTEDLTVGEQLTQRAKGANERINTALDTGLTPARDTLESSEGLKGVVKERLRKDMESRVDASSPFYKAVFEETPKISNTETKKIKELFNNKEFRQALSDAYSDLRKKKPQSGSETPQGVAEKLLSFFIKKAKGSNKYQLDTEVLKKTQSFISKNLEGTNRELFPTKYRELAGINRDLKEILYETNPNIKYADQIHDTSGILGDGTYKNRYEFIQFLGGKKDPQQIVKTFLTKTPGEIKRFVENLDDEGKASVVASVRSAISDIVDAKRNTQNAVSRLANIKAVEDKLTAALGEEGYQRISRMLELEDMMALGKVGTHEGSSSVANLISYLEGNNTFGNVKDATTVGRDLASAARGNYLPAVGNMVQKIEDVMNKGRGTPQGRDALIKVLFDRDSAIPFLDKYGELFNKRLKKQGRNKRIEEIGRHYGALGARQELRQYDERDR